MGRRNKSYSKDLHQQAYDRLVAMQAFGESKKEAIKEGTDRDKIFSFNTYKTYWKHIKYFISYMKDRHPEVTTLKKARGYVSEWLQSRVDQTDESGNHLSAWTIQTEAKALSKLFGIQPDDKDYFTPPKRNRADIVRSRGDRERDKHFSEANNDELIKFCRATGLRRSELEKLKGKDLMTKAQIEKAIKTYEAKTDPTERDVRMLETLKDTRLFEGSEFFLYIKGKGGRERISPIIGKQTDKVVARIKGTPRGENVWQYVNSNADIHSYRSEYATTIYKQYARKIEDIPYDKETSTGRKYQSDLYICRKDEAKKRLDKRAMFICSKALGHNRICVVADNYIRGL